MEVDMDRREEIIETIDRDTGIELQEYLDSWAATVIMSMTASLDVIQKSDCQRVDGDAADDGSRFSWIGGRCDCLFGDASGVILFGFRRTEFSEIDSLRVFTYLYIWAFCLF